MRRPGALDLAFNVEALVAARLHTALQLRAALGINQQGIYRLVNAEGDRWAPPPVTVRPTCCLDAAPYILHVMAGTGW